MHSKVFLLASTPSKGLGPVAMSRPLRSPASFGALLRSLRRQANRT
jgi:hypothetical protein